jgi:hypothetical protein
MPMSCTSHSREGMFFAGLLCVYALCWGSRFARAEHFAPRRPISASVRPHAGNHARLSARRCAHTCAHSYILTRTRRH